MWIDNDPRHDFEHERGHPSFPGARKWVAPSALLWFVRQDR